MFMLRILLILKLSQNVLTQNLGLKNHQVHGELDLDTNSLKDICGIRKNRLVNVELLEAKWLHTGIGLGRY